MTKIGRMFNWTGTTHDEAADEEEADPHPAVEAEAGENVAC